MGEKIRFYPIDITYRIKENKAAIYIFGRTVDGKQICVIDEKFEPYFYVLLNDMEDYDNFSNKVTKLKIEDNKRIAFAVRTEIVEKKLIGTPTKLVKVYANIPADVPILRKEINGFKEVKAIYEYDIPFTKKYLIDNNITPLTITEAHGKYSQENLKVQALKVDKIIPVSDDSLPKLNVLAFDIETYSKTKEIDMEKNPILMISFYGENFKKVYTWKKFKTSEQYIEFVDGEADLILKFKEIIDHHRPDVIAGYFSDGFDFPYIIARAQHYGIDLDIGMDYGKLSHKKGRTDTVIIPGILHFDVLRFIKMNFGRTMNTESYTLEAVSRELLGEGKQGVDVGNLHHAWDHEPEKLEEFCKYNLQDSYLVYRLFEKLWPNVLEFVKIISQSPLDITQMTFSQLVESYIMKKAQMFNEVTLNRPHYNEENERRMTRYEGAFVFEPKPGLYSDIVVFDFRSLYPSIISSHNICISTLRTSDAKSNPDCAVVPDKNYGFLKKPKGFLPTILEELISRRARVKEILKANKDPLLEARSNSLKLLANSFYGYLGFSGARWYCLECATAVTAYGRYYITKVIEEAKQKGFEVIYSDTDSIFMTLGEKKLEDAKRFVEDVNEKLPGMMELEYESHYPYGIFVSTKSNTGGAKKRYALIDDSGKLKIRGFEMVRSNWSEIGKDVQETTLSIILRENNPEKALKYVKQVIADVRDKKIPNEKVIIKTQITKQLDEYTAVGPNVAAARRMIERGDNVRPGSTVKFIITPGKGALRDKVKLPDEVKEGEYDSDYYIDNQIIPTVDKIFEVLGYNIEELTAKHNQKNLSSFFK